MIGIISDIHGNLSALESVISSLDNLGVSKIYCLGDTAGYYSEVNSCCDILRQLQVQTLLGNHDWYLVSGERSLRSTSVNQCIEYQRSVIKSTNFEWLTSLSPKFDDEEMSLRHGGWLDAIDEYVVPSDEYFSQFVGKKFCSGHTHVPKIWAGEKVVYCNPGSVGQPRDGDPRSSFATYADGAFQIHRVDYDIERTQFKMKSAGFDEYFYKNLSLGLRIGQVLP